MTYNVFSGTLNPTHPTPSPRLWAPKTISSYSFYRIVRIFGYIVERTNTKILSSHFFAISILNPNYVVINDVISGFAKVVVE